MKYKLTNKYITVENKKLYQIKALKDFNDIKKDSLGGYIESKNNLSQKYDCWVYDNAKVYGNARVSFNAMVYGNAQVYGGAMVYGDAKIYSTAKVYGHAQIYDETVISGNSRVYGNAHVFENAKIFGNTKIFGNAIVYGNAQISGDAWPISPFYLQLPKHSITSFNYTYLKIGCRVYTIEDWYDKGKELGKENGYSDTEIELYIEAIRLAEKHIELVKKSVKK